MDKYIVKKCLDFILTIFLSPIAILILILMSLFSLIQFVYKATLLFVIVAISTPFAILYNLSLLVFKFKFRNLCDSRLDDWNSIDPRASVGIEVQLIVSDFFKVVAGELLLVMSTGVITFYTAPRLVFYISLVVGITAILLKWLNTNSLSKTALSCLCDGYGLSPMMFLFSFIGLFDIGCHPIAKCSFAATRAFLFEKNVTNMGEGIFPFKNTTTNQPRPFVEFLRWNAFERGLFQLNPRISFIERKSGKCILKSFMVLRLLDNVICTYPVERLELPEDYSKANELYNFLVTLSLHDGFVTNKMKGRYEESLTLLEIVDGVDANDGYRIIKPMDSRFVVATNTNKRE